MSLGHTLVTSRVAGASRVLDQVLQMRSAKQSNALGSEARQGLALDSRMPWQSVPQLLLEPSGHRLLSLLLLGTLRSSSHSSPGLSHLEPALQAVWQRSSEVIAS